MTLTTKEELGWHVVALAGSLDTNTSRDAEVFLSQLLDDGNKKLLLDFSEVEYVSSSGLRILLSLSKRMKGEKGDLRLFGLNDTVKEVFDISGFSMIFQIFATKEAAHGA